MRRCVSALAADDSLFARSLEYRFEGGALTGHPIGNLLITGLTMASGDFQRAIDELCRLVAAEGSLFPATAVPVRLLADADEGTITGQVTIERATNIRNVRFDPAHPPHDEAAAKAIRDADQVVIGPGSLFTSVLACAVVPGLRQALVESQGQRVYVANVANEKAEARGFGLVQHLDALEGHGVPIDAVVAHGTGASTVEYPVTVHWADLAAADGWSHDPVRLGAALRTVANSGRSATSSLNERPGV